MAMQYDVKATAIAAAQTDAAVFAGPARIKGLIVAIPAAGGTLTLKNGSGGATRFSFVAPAGDATVTNILIPGEGIRCDDGIYATTPANMPITVFYG
jgi:hypothetical protein